ncbi:hypothetical protein B1813_09250 [Saccharomonospora piscinae]|uniref:Gram-positive cocci surface proteins LPxTG domain-containing protein n=1 Tax=Saccharomonospora piscinae TaxID=687388 RepID=A0A1V9A5M2_SACPI|nr:hypothetical protein [Saccharomonospora piscinae]OQO92381.1 hypothetical protein B1813_09250 [Saccharomonospora piscinae]
MSLSTRTRLRSMAVAALTLGLVVGPNSVAAASDAEEDPRAEVHEGNLTDCDGFGGGLLVSVGDDEQVENLPGLTYDGGDTSSDKHVTVTDVPDDIVVTAIVVKGGPGYNVYVPGERELSSEAPWEDLRSPVNPGGQIPTISHWFVCGAEASEPTTDPQEPTGEPEEPSTSESPGKPDESEETEPGAPTSESPGETPTTAPERGSSAPATTTTDAAPVVNDDDLASTGLSSGWLIGVGAALVVGGGALLALTRLRRRSTT